MAWDQKCKEGSNKGQPHDFLIVDDRCPTPVMPANLVGQVETRQWETETRGVSASYEGCALCNEGTSPGWQSGNLNL